MSQAALAGRRRGVSASAGAGVLVVLFVLGIVVGQIGLAGVGRGLVSAFEAIAGAHYQLYLARENLNAEGEAEYAVLLADGGRDAIEEFVSRRPGWSARSSIVPGWVVLTAPADAPQALQRLRDAPFSRAVLRNRGMWICH